MPRPKRSNESLRQYHIGVRLNESEYGKICRESEEIGVTVSEYVRAKTIKGSIRVPKYAKIDTDAINLLSNVTRSWLMRTFSQTSYERTLSQTNDMGDASHEATRHIDNL